MRRCPGEVAGKPPWKRTGLPVFHVHDDHHDGPPFVLLSMPRTPPLRPCGCGLESESYGRRALRHKEALHNGGKQMTTRTMVGAPPAGKWLDTASPDGVDKAKHSAHRALVCTRHETPRGADVGRERRSVARPARFERTTPAFGGQYSIQLSYGRGACRQEPARARENTLFLRIMEAPAAQDTDNARSWARTEIRQGRTARLSFRP